MKKILGISLVAMMAVTAANADIASKAYVNQQDNLIKADIGTVSNLDTDSKVVVPAINELKSAVDGLNSGAGSVASQIEDVVGDLNAAEGGLTGFDDNTDTVVEALNELMDEKLDKNAEITAGTHTKITYDADGLVTGGADLAVADLPASSVVGSGSITVTRNAANAESNPNAFSVSVANASTSAAGVVQLADATAITAGTEGRVVDAAQLKAVADGASGSYQTKIGGNSGQLVTSSGTAGSVNFVTPQTTAAAASGSTTGAIMTDTAVRATITDLNLGSMATETAANYTKTADLDSTVNATAGKVVTAISMADGVLSTTVEDPLTQANYDTQAAGVSLGDGSYVLTMKVVDTVPTYKWELVERDTQGD